DLVAKWTECAVIEDVLADEGDHNKSFKVRRPVIIYGNCAQWTPVLMIGANLARAPFYFVDKRQRLIELIEQHRAISSGSLFSLFVCHKNRVDELTRILEEPIAEKRPILDDYVLLKLSTRRTVDESCGEPLDIAYLVNTSGTS